MHTSSWTRVNGKLAVFEMGLGSYGNLVWQSDRNILPLSWSWDPADRQRHLSPKMTLIRKYELGRVARDRIPKRIGSLDRWWQKWDMW